MLSTYYKVADPNPVSKTPTENSKNQLPANIEAPQNQQAGSIEKSKTEAERLPIKPSTTEHLHNNPPLKHPVPTYNSSSSIFSSAEPSNESDKFEFIKETPTKSPSPHPEVPKPTKQSPSLTLEEHQQAFTINYPALPKQPAHQPEPLKICIHVPDPSPAAVPVTPVRASKPEDTESLTLPSARTSKALKESEDRGLFVQFSYSNSRPSTPANNYTMETISRTGSPDCEIPEGILHGPDDSDSFSNFSSGLH